MSTRTALLFASAALLAVASPAQAQDGRYGNLPDTGGYADAARDAADAAAEAEDAGWREGRGRHDNGRHRGEMHHDDMHHDDMRHDDMRRDDMRRDNAPRLAYSPEQREDWLADCRIVMRGEDYYYDQEDIADRDDRHGGLIGGLLGAVVGGVAGNRIGGAGDRLAGTLIGTAVGGIAGAVLGSAISGGGDDDDYSHDGRRSAGAADAYAADYCDAYLRRYEASGSTGQYAAAYAQPVMMMQVAPAHQNGEIREIVREEWVEVAEEPVRVRRHAAPHHRGKLTRVD